MTGANGFTGSHLARLLIDAGYSVRALVRSSSDLTLLKGLDLEIVYADLINTADVSSVVQGVDRIFHIAAVYREAKFPDSYYRDVNVEGTRRLGEAALAEGGIPILYCSSCGVHGEVKPVANEMSPYNPGDIYQRTKVEAERVILTLHRERGLPVTILRPVGIYGPGDRRFLKLFRGVSRRVFPMIGNGSALYHLTHVEDVARGFIKAAETDSANGQVYIIAGPRFTTVSELVELIAKIAGVKPPWLRLPIAPLYMSAVICEALCRPVGIEPPLHRRRLDFFLKDRAFSIEKARRDLGWEPLVELEVGITSTIEWYRKAGWI